MSADDSVWLIEGDDHECELVEAATVEEALDAAHAGFTDRYGRYDRGLLTVLGNFTGDVDDTDSLRFRPTPEAPDEQAAYRALAQL